MIEQIGLSSKDGRGGGRDGGWIGCRDKGSPSLIAMKVSVRLDWGLVRHHAWAISVFKSQYR